MPLVCGLRLRCADFEIVGPFFPAQTCLKNINGGLAFPGRREDFDSEEAWQSWWGAEVSRLSRLVMTMVQSTTDRDGRVETRHSSVPRIVAVDVDALVSEVEGDDEIQMGAPFIFIPPDPRRFYKRLLEICIDRDLVSPARLPVSTRQSTC